MEEELGNEEQEKTYNFDRYTDQGMEESGNEPLEETDKENELRLNQLLEETKKNGMGS